LRVRAERSRVGTFTGGITNTGSVNSANFDGIFVGGVALLSGTSAVVSTFLGGILNTGTIIAGNSGIHVGGTASLTGIAGVSSFAGGVSNAGNILAGFTGNNNLPS
jgi:hypothetical protein